MAQTKKLYDKAWLGGGFGGGQKRYLDGLPLEIPHHGPSSGVLCTQADMYLGKHVRQANHVGVRQWKQAIDRDGLGYRSSCSFDGMCSHLYAALLWVGFNGKVRWVTQVPNWPILFENGAFVWY